MRSAIYYPNFEVRDPSVLRTALLMWDELHVIAPFKGLLPYYPDQGFAEAWELIGRTMVPDHAQKEKAHEDLVDFARRPLPADAYYRVESPPEDFYDIYPQKLLPKTWLAPVRGRHRRPAPGRWGLSVSAAGRRRRDGKAC